MGRAPTYREVEMTQANNPQPIKKAAAPKAQADQNVETKEETKTENTDQRFHDSMTGRAVDKDGRFLEGDEEGPIPAHRIVSDSWAEDRPKIDEDNAETK